MKAILVLDEMPSDCLKCPLCFSDSEDTICALSLDKSIPYTGDSDFKPSWCPLRRMPPKMPIHESGYGSDILTKTEHEGWNKCLRAIEGSGKHETSDNKE